MTAKCKTICARCKHKIFRGGIWCDQYCGHPAVERIPEQDPVTGKIGYGGTNDLGGSYITDEKHPHCRDINHGNCPHYEATLAGRLLSRKRRPE